MSLLRGNVEEVLQVRCNSPN